MLMHMSISGGILIILIMALRMLAVKRLPKKVFVLLWEIAALRLLIPFDLPFQYGIASPVTEKAERAVLDMSRPASGNIDWRMALWILGIAILLFIFGIRYYRESQRLANALPVSKDADEILRMLVKIPERVKICVSDRTSTPLTVGMVQPRIILPKQLRADRIDLKYVLAHEMVHIRRADNVLKMIMLMAACIHWFNPLAWMMYLFFDRDIELSCDERVLEIYGEKQKKKYAETLLDLAETQYQWSLFLNGFGKSAIQERIVAIMNFKKISIAGIVCAVLMTGTAMTVFASGSAAVPEKSSGAGAGMVEIEQGDSTDTRYFQSEDGLTEVEVTVQDEMKDEYQIETAETENGEVTVSISSEASESE